MKWALYCRVLSIILGGSICLAADVQPSTPAAPSQDIKGSGKGLQFAEGPADGRAIALQAAGAFDQAKYGSQPPNDAILLPVYHLTPSITKETLDTQATISAYYYLVEFNHQVRNEVTLTVDKTTGGFLSPKISFNPEGISNPLPAFADALAALAKLEQVQAGSYEPRLLRYGSAGPNGAEVIWLKSTLDSADLIYALQIDTNHNPPTLLPSKLYTLPEYVAFASAKEKMAEQKRLANLEASQAAITENKRKVTSGEDTVSTRLQALAKSLDGALAAFQEMPPDTYKYFSKAPADLALARATVASGLDYIKAHPEEDSLVSRIKDVDIHVGGLMTNRFTGYSPSMEPHLQIVAKFITSGYSTFIGDPSIGRPLMGDIGGNRDTLTRELSIAGLEIDADFEDFHQATGATPLKPSDMQLRGASLKAAFKAALADGLANPAHSGSVTGSVAWSDGKPAIFAPVWFDIMNLPNSPPLSGSNTEIYGSAPMTYAGENGNFTIKNLSPGTYAISAAGGHWVFVEVKEGVETKLEMPLQYIKPAYGGG